jgi:formyltetrahydrofolate-dependent phosphoribosylglycinamide formyltransferase
LLSAKISLTANNIYNLRTVPSDMKKRVAVLISGYGGNLQALIDSCKNPEFGAEIVLVVSNKANAFGLQRAKNNNIEAVFIDNKNYKTREEFDNEIHKKLLEFKVEIVCLAGFMRLLSAEFVNKWQGRMINIHPSLLPDFKGANAVEDAFKAGVKKTGCTVHYVVPEMDAGEIILQREVEILPNDTIEKLYERIHVQEHIAYSQALKLVIEKL